MTSLDYRVDSHLHPVPSWDVNAHPQPKGSEEIWRFTLMRVIAPLLAGENSDAQLETELSLPDGVTSRRITIEEAREISQDAPVDRVAAYAAQNAPDVLLIEVPAEWESDEPIDLKFTGNGELAHGWTIIKIGHHAKATVVISRFGSAKFLEKTDIFCGDSSNVSIVNLQDWAPDTLHGGQVSYRVGRDAQVRTTSASLGGRLIRLVERASYDGPGGDLEQLGLYFVNGEKHVEYRTFVDHSAPKTVSLCDYRGVLQGKGAHSVWVGDVLIRKVAEGINTYESNKNLVLTEGCRADSVPNLEIETGEIEGAGHSASTGRFDDEQLFYLRSRGISESEAKRLVVEGFFLDIINKIGVSAIEERLVVALQAELEIMTDTPKEN